MVIDRIRGDIDNTIDMAITRDMGSVRVSLT
jgi:hypothetical protein